MAGVSFASERAFAFPYLVKDIKPGALGSSPSRMVAYGSEVVFFADDGVNGTELWKTDGTTQGTVLLKDINPGALGSTTYGLVDKPTLYNGELWFGAGNAQWGLWKTNGTSAGTVQVKANVMVANIVNAAGRLYFAGYQSGIGAELWTSDGTDAGTILLKDIATGSSSGVTSYAKFLVPWNGTGAIFVADARGSIGEELWKTDGTPAGTVLVKDIYPGGSDSRITDLVVNGGTVYFTAENGTNGRELWKSDGTEAGTVMVKDIVAGSSSSYPSYLTVMNGYVYFTAQQGIWRSDGTDAGTVMIKQQTGGAYLTNVNGTLFYWGYDATNGYELWKSDGNGNASLVKDITPGAASSYFSIASCVPRASGNYFVFCTDDQTRGVELWRSDGTAAGTVPIEVSVYGNSDPIDFEVVGTKVYVSANNGYAGTELWASDGPNAQVVPAAAGITPYLVKDIKPGYADSMPRMFASLNNQLLFYADDGVNGAELWRSDGTTLGTTLLKDIRFGPLGSAILTQAPIVLGNHAYFTATSTGYGLWRTDGTTAGTLEVKSGVLFQSIINANGTLFMYGTDNAGSTGTELWKSDGSTAGTVIVKDIRPGSSSGITSYSAPKPVFSGTNVYFLADDGTNGVELWKSDGSAANTTMVKNLTAGSSSSSINYMTDVNGTLFFVFGDYQNAQIWKSDGTDANTVVVSAHPQYAFPQGLVSFNNTLYYGAASGLWKSDGTLAGTTMVKQVYVNGPIVSANGVMWFYGGENQTGYELWKSDGTTGGTVMVKDIYPGTASSNRTATCPIRAAGNVVVFCAEDGTHGIEPWQSDGTAAGTIPMQISPAGNSRVSDMLWVNGKIFFAASDGQSGHELWAIGGGGPGPQPDAGASSSGGSSGTSGGGAGGASSSSGGASSSSSSSSGGPNGVDPQSGEVGTGDGGCGCKTANAPAMGGSTFLVLAALGFLRRRRSPRG